MQQEVHDGEKAVTREFKLEAVRLEFERQAGLAQAVSTEPGAAHFCRLKRRLTASPLQFLA
jgi:hypothetical protein